MCQQYIIAKVRKKRHILELDHVMVLQLISNGFDATNDIVN